MVNLDERNKLILDNISFANQIAAKQFKITPKCFYFDELKSAAYMGLVEAAIRYRGQVPFRGFAFKRIQGEIIDYIRFRYRGGLQENLESLR